MKKVAIVEVLVSDAKYQVLKELSECKHIAFSVLVDKYGRGLLDNMVSKKLIVRIFHKRGTVINSFLKLTGNGKDILDTAIIIKGEENGNGTTDLQKVRRDGENSRLFNTTTEHEDDSNIQMS